MSEKGNQSFVYGGSSQETAPSKGLSHISPLSGVISLITPDAAQKKVWISFTALNQIYKKEKGV
jgi:hypothetical protein